MQNTASAFGLHLLFQTKPQNFYFCPHKFRVRSEMTILLSKVAGTVANRLVSVTIRED